MFKQLLESVGAYLRYGSKVLRLPEAPPSAAEAYDELEDTDSTFSKHLINVLKRMLGEGSSFEVTLEDYHLQKSYYLGEEPNVIKLTFLIDGLELDSEPQKTIQCTIEY